MTRVWHARRPGPRAYISEAGGIYTPPSGGGTMDIGALGTFTRSSIATWWDGTTLTSYTTNELREPETDWLAIEGSRVNYVYNSESINNWSIKTNITVTDNNGTDPYGNAASASRVLHDGSSNSYIQDTTLDPGGSGYFTFSAFLKGATGSDNPDQRPYWQNATTTDTLSLTTSWARYDTIQTTASTSGNDKVIYKDGDASTDDYHLFGCQFELAGPSFPSSYIPSDNGVSATTRSADDLQIAHADVESWFLTGEWSVTIRPEFTNGEMVNSAADQTLFGFDGGTEFLRLIVDAGSVKVRLSDGTTTTTTGAITFSRDQSITITCDMATGNVTIADATTGNGTTTGSGAITFPSSTDVRVGADFAGTKPYFGLINTTIQQA